MKLSRHTFLTGILGTLGTAALALAGCGGGRSDDEPATIDPVLYPIVYPGYTRTTVVNPTGTIEATTHAKPGEVAKYLTYRILKGGKGSQRGEQILFATEMYYAGEVLGQDTKLLWSPDGTRLYYMPSIREAPEAWWDTSISVATFVPDEQEGVRLSSITPRYDTNFRSMERRLDPDIAIFLTDISNDGSYLYYSKKFAADEGAYNLGYTFEIATGHVTQQGPLQ